MSPSEEKKSGRTSSLHSPIPEVASGRSQLACCTQGPSLVPHVPSLVAWRRTNGGWTRVFPAASKTWYTTRTERRVAYTVAVRSCATTVVAASRLTVKSVESIGVVSPDTQRSTLPESVPGSTAGASPS